VVVFLRRNAYLLHFLIHFVVHTLSCGVDFNIGPGVLDTSATWNTQTHHFPARSSVECFFIQLIRCSWFWMVETCTEYFSAAWSPKILCSWTKWGLCWNLPLRGRVWSLKLCKKWSSTAQHSILGRNSPYSLSDINRLVDVLDRNYFHFGGNGIFIIYWDKFEASNIYRQVSQWKRWESFATIAFIMPPNGKEECVVKS
jgi:hypothetical protein